MARSELHEQDHALVVLPVLSHSEAISNLRQLFQLGVDLRRANANTGRLEHRVGATIESHAASIAMDKNVIAVPPDMRKHSEVGVAVFCPRRIVPEVDWH